MFRRLPTGLPAEPTFPHNLRKLGYFINPQGFIKRIDFPEDDFQFHITNNERYNDVNREAMHACIRSEVITRLTALNLPPLYLPTLTPDAPSPHTTASLPILSTPFSTLPHKTRLIILLNTLASDLGILAYRLLSKTHGIDAGSTVAFVQEIFRRAGGEGAKGAPGVMVLNPGQLLYSYRAGRAMTPVSWDAVARKSAVHPIVGVHPELNHVPGNGTVAEHLEFVFGKILGDEVRVSKGTEIYLVGLGDGGDELVKFLETNWTNLTSTLNIRALALTSPLPIPLASTSPIPLTNTSFLTFMSTRAKAWALSSLPLGEPIADATVFPLQEPEAGTNESNSEEEPITEEADDDQGEKDINADVTNWSNPPDAPEPNAHIHLCPTVSGGEELFTECVMPAAYNAILDWFEGVAKADVGANVGGAGSGEGGRGAGAATSTSISSPSDEIPAFTTASSGVA